jgi:hypothetical protein
MRIQWSTLSPLLGLQLIVSSIVHAESPAVVSISVHDALACTLDSAGTIRCAENPPFRLPADGSARALAVSSQTLCTADVTGQLECRRGSASSRCQLPDRRVMDVVLRPRLSPLSAQEGVLLDDQGQLSAFTLTPEGALRCSPAPLELRFADGTPATGQQAHAPRLGNDAVYALDSTGHLLWWGKTGAVPAQLGGTFKQLEASDTYLCGLRNDGGLRCYTQEEVQVPPEPGTFQHISLGASSLCAVTTTGEARCWTLPDWKASPPSGGRFSQVRVDGDTRCGIAEGGAVYCWGSRAPFPGPDMSQNAPLHFVASDQTPLFLRPPDTEAAPASMLRLGTPCWSATPSTPDSLWACMEDGIRVGYLDSRALSTSPQDFAGAQLLYVRELDRLGSKLDQEMDPVNRGKLYVSLRRAEFEGKATMCLQAPEHAACSDAILALADLELITSPARPRSALPCEGSPDETRAELRQAACVEAMLGPGITVLEGQTGESVPVNRFVHFSPSPAGASLQLGVFRGDTLALASPRLETSSLLAGAVDAALARGKTLLRLEVPVDQTTHSGGRFGTFSNGRIVSPTELPGELAIYCKTGNTFTRTRSETQDTPFIDLDGNSNRLHWLYARPVDCLEGWYFEGIPGIQAPSLTPLQPARQSADSADATGSRYQEFAGVRFIHAAEGSPANPTSTAFLEYQGTRHSVCRDARCSVRLATDFNGDGLPDFVLRTAHEICVDFQLYLSTATGWNNSASSQSCD